jgi:hypothetical protein
MCSAWNSLMALCSSTELQKSTLNFYTNCVKFHWFDRLRT